MKKERLISRLVQMSNDSYSEDCADQNELNKLKQNRQLFDGFEKILKDILIEDDDMQMCRWDGFVNFMLLSEIHFSSVTGIDVSEGSRLFSAYLPWVLRNSEILEMERL